MATDISGTQGAFRSWQKWTTAVWGDQQYVDVALLAQHEVARAA